MTPEDYYKAVHLGIARARNIRQTLQKHPTEYYPEMVRSLNEGYLSTIRNIIKQGDLYIDTDDDFEKGIEIAQIVENYKAFLGTIRD
jgi:hypothetical protein